MLSEKEKIAESNKWLRLFAFMVDQASHGALSVEGMRASLLNDINSLIIEEENEQGTT